MILKNWHILKPFHYYYYNKNIAKKVYLPKICFEWAKGANERKNPGREWGEKSWKRKSKIGYQKNQRHKWWKVKHYKWKDQWPKQIKFCHFHTLFIISSNIYPLNIDFASDPQSWQFHSILAKIPALIKCVAVNCLVESKSATVLGRRRFTVWLLKIIFCQPKNILSPNKNPKKSLRV